MFDAGAVVLGVHQIRGTICALLAVVGLWLPTQACAEEVTVLRHVTIRQGPARSSAVVVFPEVGSPLTLLDGGSRVRGYYRVVTADGREGFVYYTFVSRPAGREAGAALSAMSAQDRISVHYIDVDQGSAALLEFPCAAVLIDTGGRGAKASDHLIEYLDAFFARRPDLNQQLAAVFVTHTHIDHNSNLERVARRYAIGSYIHNGLLDGSGRYPARWMVGYPPNTAPFAPTANPPIRVRSIAQSEVVQAGGSLTDSVIDPVACPRVDPSIKVLSGRYEEDPGWDGDEFENGNNQSLVIRVDYGAASFLFTGDLEEPAIETLVERFAGTPQLDVDVYLSGHHGAYNGTTPSLLKAMTPEVAIISAGDPKVQEMWTAYRYGHPRRTLVSLLDSGVSGRRPAVDVQVADKVKVFTPFRLTGAVYATSWDHDISVSSGADGRLSVEAGR